MEVRVFCVGVEEEDTGQGLTGYEIQSRPFL